MHQGGADVGDCNGTCQGFSALWPAISRCSQLRHLEVRVLADVHDGEHHGVQVTEHNQALAGALGQLLQLTHLVLEAGQVACGCEPDDRDEVKLLGGPL